MNEAEMNAVVARVPFFRFIGFSVTEASAETCQATLPFRETLIGNPVARNFHGGIVASVMEVLASLAVMRDGTDAIPKPVNITVDYLRPARATTLLAGAIVTRRGRRLVSVRAEAWQEDRSKLVAQGLVHFLIA